MSKRTQNFECRTTPIEQVSVGTRFGKNYASRYASVDPVRIVFRRCFRLLPADVSTAKYPLIKAFSCVELTAVNELWGLIGERTPPQRAIFVNITLPLMSRHFAVYV